MKNIKTSILKASMIALGFQPIVSNAQWAINGPALANIVYTNATVGIVGTNFLEFGYGMAGKQADAGKIGYATFDPSALCIVGAGTVGANRRIHFYNEGGAYFEGGAIFSGNIGIGTTNPQTKLHISETASGNVSVALKIEALNTGQAGLTIQAGQGATNRSARIDFLNGVSSSTVPRWTFINDYDQTGINDFSIADNSGNRKFTMLQGGNAGIGTTNPQSKLHVAETAPGNVSVALKIEALNTGQAGITIQAGQGATNRSARIDLLNSVASTTVPRWTLINDYDQTGINDFSIADNSGNRKFTILQGGNVGIGITTPLAKLHVNGGAIIIGVNGPAGKVAGTDYMLAVKGAIYSTEVNVIPAWADYVFKSDYKLPSLADVEAHIKENGHLKDVPSAEEVAKNGIKLGEMDATLLRKIEELTLYILAQQKELKAQGEKIKALEKK